MQKIPGEITRYIGRIKNQNKKQYAEQWLAYRMFNGKHPECSGSTMAAQLVRMTIDGILMEYGYTGESEDGDVMKEQNQIYNSDIQRSISRYL